MIGGSRTKTGFQVSRSKARPASDTGHARRNAPPSVERVISAPGTALDPEIRVQAERQFGHEFSRIRVHADQAAAASASEIAADAYYAVGNHIVFGEQRYAPRSTDGRALLSHELTHAHTNAGCSSLVAPGITSGRPSTSNSNPASSVEIPAVVDEVLHRPSQPLDRATRQDMEGRFQHDFSTVRVHVGERAAASADAVDALAYTVGHHVVFGRGQYTPTNAPGRQLLAHELAHVVQQGRGAASHSPAHDVSLDRFAAQAATAAVQGNGRVSVAGASLPRLARQPKRENHLSEEEIRKLLGLPEQPDAQARKVIYAGQPPSAVEQEAAEKVAAGMPPTELTPHVPPGYIEMATKLVQGGVITRAAPPPRVQRKPLKDLLPPPRTAFEDYAQNRLLETVRDPATGSVIGYLEWEQGVLHLKNVEGEKVMTVAEKPLETPLIDPLDLIPLGLVRSLAAKAATFTGRAVGKAFAKEMTAEGTKLAIRKAGTLSAEEAGEAVGKQLLVSGEQAIGSRAPKGPEVVEELTSELGLSRPGSQGLTSVRAAAEEAQAAGLMRGAEPGLADLAVQSHASAPAVRKALGLTGKTQSAHIGPTSALRDLPGYNRGRALTTLLPEEVHAALDQRWKDWAVALRRQGRTDVTVRELYGAMSEAIQKTPGMPGRMKQAFDWKLQDELFRHLELTWDDLVALPYPSVKPIP